MEVPLRRIGGVNAARESSGKDGGIVGDRPLRGVEADDADRVVPLQAEPDEGLGDGARLGEILPERPLLPPSGALHGERGLVRVELRRPSEQRRHAHRRPLARRRLLRVSQQHRAVRPRRGVARRGQELVGPTREVHVFLHSRGVTK